MEDESRGTDCFKAESFDSTELQPDENRNDSSNFIWHKIALEVEVSSMADSESIQTKTTTEDFEYGKIGTLAEDRIQNFDESNRDSAESSLVDSKDFNRKRQSAEVENQVGRDGDDEKMEVSPAVKRDFGSAGDVVDRILSKDSVNLKDEENLTLRSSTDSHEQFQIVLQQQQQQQPEFPATNQDLCQPDSSMTSNLLPVGAPNAFVPSSDLSNQFLCQSDLSSGLAQVKLLQRSLAPTAVILFDPSKDRQHLTDCMLLRNATDNNASPIFLLNVHLNGQPFQTTVVNNISATENSQIVQPFKSDQSSEVTLAGTDNIEQQQQQQQSVRGLVVPTGSSQTMELWHLPEDVLRANNRKSDRLKTKKQSGWKTGEEQSEDEPQVLRLTRKRRTTSRSLRQVEDREKLAKYESEAAPLTPSALTRCQIEDDRGGGGRPVQSPTAAYGSSPASNTRMFTCATCNKDFTTEKYLSMHMSLHIPNQSNNSSTVGTGGVGVSGFTSGGSGGGVGIEELPIRRSKATSPGATAQWTCKICEKTFAQNSNYKNHIRTHSNERPFVCEICSIGFKERYHLKKHVLFKHTSELKEKCRFCDKCFKDSTAVRAHERTHSDQRPYPCPRCDKTFKTSECLWHHVNRSKTCGKSLGEMPPASAAPRSVGARVGVGVGVGQTTIPSVVTEEFVVPMVDHEQVVPQVDGQQLSLSEQVQRCVSYQRFQPEVVEAMPSMVGTSFWSIPGEQLHPEPPRQHQQHQQGVVEEEGPIPAVKVEMEMNIFDYDLTGINSPESSSLEGYCEEFEQNIEDEDDLISNITPETDDITISEFSEARRNSTTQPPSSPRTAGSSSPTSSSFPVSAQPLATSKSRGLDCGACGKQYSTQSAFDKHSIVHSESRPHRCDVCNIGFKLKVHLKKHNLYRHSDDYPCECSICGKRFKDSSAVRLHERIHSTERPFKCHCGKGFKTRENLWGHKHRGPCDKPENFLIQNLRLYNSDIGPIWGVPLGVNQILANVQPISGNTDVYIKNQTTTPDQGHSAGSSDLEIQGTAQRVIAPTTTTIPPNRSRVFKTWVKKETSIGGLEPQNLQSSSSSSLFSSSSMSSSGVYPPTAVVVPIKREMNETATTATTTTRTDMPLSSSSSSLLVGEKCSLPPFETLVTTHRPPVSVSSAQNENGGNRCPPPSAQKILLMNAPSVPHPQVRLPGIQQLFQTHTGTTTTSIIPASSATSKVMAGRTVDSLAMGSAPPSSSPGSLGSIGSLGAAEGFVIDVKSHNNYLSHFQQQLHHQQQQQQQDDCSSYQVLYLSEGEGGRGTGGDQPFSHQLSHPPPPYSTESCPSPFVAQVITGSGVTRSANLGQVLMTSSPSVAFWKEGEGGGGRVVLPVTSSGVDSKNSYALQWLTSGSSTQTEAALNQMGSTVSRY